MLAIGKKSWLESFAVLRSFPALHHHMIACTLTQQLAEKQQLASISYFGTLIFSLGK